MSGCPVCFVDPRGISALLWAATALLHHRYLCAPGFVDTQHFSSFELPPPLLPVCMYVCASRWWSFSTWRSGRSRSSWQQREGRAYAGSCRFCAWLQNVYEREATSINGRGPEGGWESMYSPECTSGRQNLDMSFSHLFSRDGTLSGSRSHALPGVPEPFGMHALPGVPAALHHLGMRAVYSSVLANSPPYVPLSSVKCY